VQEEFGCLRSTTINMISTPFFLTTFSKEVRDLAYGGQRESNAPLRHCRPWTTRPDEGEEKPENRAGGLLRMEGCVFWGRDHRHVCVRTHCNPGVK
jgi:hypothetical protein